MGNPRDTMRRYAELRPTRVGVSVPADRFRMVMEIIDEDYVLSAKVKAETARVFKRLQAIK